MASELGGEALELLGTRKDTLVPETSNLAAEDLSFPAPIDTIEGSDYEAEAKEAESLARLEGVTSSHSKPAYMESMEEWENGHESEGAIQEVDNEDIEGAGELVAGLVGNAKTFINRYFKKEFKRRITQEFPKDKQQLLSLVQFLDQQNEINSQSIDTMKKFAELYSVSLQDIISAYVTYTEIREELQASGYEEWQKQGIKKYTEKCVRKYFVNQAPDPAIMLGLYILTSLGMDVGKIVMNRLNKE